jgi:hypothetical protein
LIENEKKNINNKNATKTTKTTTTTTKRGRDHYTNKQTIIKLVRIRTITEARKYKINS